MIIKNINFRKYKIKTIFNLVERRKTCTLGSVLKLSMFSYRKITFININFQFPNNIMFILKR
jgi:hypothetical protein